MLAWTLTCLGLMVLPGPDMALVTRWTLTGGARAGWRAVLGILCGFAVYALLLIAGASAALAGAPLVVEVLRIAGGAYLVWLGLVAWRAAAQSGPLATPAPARGPWASGVISNLLNPKQTLFLLALVPQFVPTGGGPADVALLLAVLTAVSLIFWAGWIAALSRLGERLAQHHLWIERITSLCLWRLGPCFWQA